MLLVTGCGGIARQAGKEAAAPATGGTLQAMTQPDNQQLIEQISQTPGAQNATWELGNGIGHGIVDRIFVDAGFAPATRAGDPPAQTLGSRYPILSTAAWVGLGLLVFIALSLLGLIVCLAMLVHRLRREPPRPGPRRVAERVTLRDEPSG